MREKRIERSTREKVNFFRNLGEILWASEPVEKNQEQELEEYKNETASNRKLLKEALKNVANMEKMVEVPNRKSQKKTEILSNQKKSELKQAQDISKVNGKNKSKQEKIEKEQEI